MVTRSPPAASYERLGSEVERLCRNLDAGIVHCTTFNGVLHRNCAAWPSACPVGEAIRPLGRHRWAIH